MEHVAALGKSSDGHILIKLVEAYAAAFFFQIYWKLVWNFDAIKTRNLVLGHASLPETTIEERLQFFVIDF